MGFLGFQGYAQLPKLSQDATVSVISCGPGAELYSKFGHSALRIKDAQNHLDIIYNYGVFDFNAPHFYLNFAKGKLHYILARHRTNDFLDSYREEGRWVHEQTLHFSNPEKQKIFQLLEENAKPENRTYPYDFFYNNCATKIIDVLSAATNNEIEFEDNFVENNLSFRGLINHEISDNSWGSLGINLALGAVIDQKATDYEHRFLPKYVELQLKQSHYQDQPLISEEATLIEASSSSLEQTLLIATPLFWVLALLFLSVGMSYRQWKYRKYPKIWDVILLSSSGIIGLFMLALWFLTDHSATVLNYNISWAFPLNVWLAYQVIQGFKNPKSSLLATHLSMFGMGVFAIIALTGIQEFNPLTYLIAMTLFVRLYFIKNHLKSIQ